MMRDNVRDIRRGGNAELWDDVDGEAESRCCTPWKSIRIYTLTDAWQYDSAGTLEGRRGSTGRSVSYVLVSPPRLPIDDVAYRRAPFRQRQRSYSDFMHRYYLHYGRARDDRIIDVLYVLSGTRSQTYPRRILLDALPLLPSLVDDVCSLCKCAAGMSVTRIMASACCSDCPLPGNRWWGRLERSDA